MAMMIYSIQKILYGERKSGFVLLFSVLVSGIVLAVGLGIISITLKELLLSNTGKDSQYAFYAADSGLECALYWDLKHEKSPFGASDGSIFGDSGTGSAPASGLVAHWAFDETSGTTAFDETGLYDGDLHDMNGSEWTTGKINNGLEFNGIKDRVEVNALDWTPTSFTVSWWLHPSSCENYNNVLKAKNEWGSFEFHVDNNCAVYVGTDLSNRFRPTDLPAGTAATGIWHHFTYTYDGTQGRFYESGTLVAGPKDQDPPTAWSGFSFGQKNTDGDLSIDGTIDDAYIYDRALSDAEVFRLYRLGDPVAASAPVAQGSSALCAGVDITDPLTGWDSSSGWDIDSNPGTYLGVDYNNSILFDLSFPNGSCSSVTVYKGDDGIVIESRGFNTCNNTDRRVERGLRVSY